MTYDQVLISALTRIAPTLRHSGSQLALAHDLATRLNLTGANHDADGGRRWLDLSPAERVAIAVEHAHAIIADQSRWLGAAK